MLNQLQQRFTILKPSAENVKPPETEPGLFDQLKAKAEQNIQKIAQNETIQKIQQTATQKFDQIDNSIKKLLLEQKEKINLWIRVKIEEAVVKMVEKLKPKAKEAIKDPDMPDCVKYAIDDSVDEVWPLVITQVKLQLRLKQGDPFVEVVNDNRPFICCRPFYCIKNWHNYAMYPYDKSIWAQMKTFSWWFFMIFESFPYYGVQPVFYIFVFLCIDKSDEYQLINYILKYKKMQFITQGLTLTSLGYFLYFNCVSMNKNAQLAYFDCLKIGPGSTENNNQLYYDIAVFFLQIVLVWFAYFLLPCSTPKGEMKFKYAKKDENEEVENTGCCGKGVLIKFLVYDLFTFGIAIGIYFWTFNEGLPIDYDQSQPQIFMAKIAYGLLSFPFLIFAAEFIANIITNAKPTAYDKYGNTVPAIHGVKIKYKNQEKTNQDNINQIFDVDIEELFGK